MNVIQLPRPHHLRVATESLAFYIRVGRNDHKEILELIAAGERGMFGFVIDASHAVRHRDLILEARKHDFDVILDPKTQQMGLPGSYSEMLAGLPWGKSKNHHTIADFEGLSGRDRASRIVEFALTHDFTQILGPTHLISDPNDPWFQRDISAMAWTADEIRRAGRNLALIYPLSLPMSLLRDDDRRSAIVSGISGAPCDSIWLKIENFGDDASGEKTEAYIKACRDFHARGLPLVADHVGGLPGLGTLAFGAVGGLAHGVTVNQHFTASNWRRPKRGGGGTTARRVYFSQLDMLLNPEDARQFIESSMRVRGRHTCRDPHCCARGLPDMLDRPARHALYQRAREIERLSEVPHSMRITTYVENVRRVSDDVALASGYEKVAAEFRQKLQEKQKILGHFREAIAHLEKTWSRETEAKVPTRRATSRGPNR